MKGYIPIEIPTKRYIKAYVISKYGEKPLMVQESEVGKKLYNLLYRIPKPKNDDAPVRPLNERKKAFSNARYNERIRIYIPMHTFRQRGCHLNETNVKDFNLFLEKIIKSRFYFMMDLYCEFLPSFTANLPEVRKRLGIDVDAWDDDSMRKDYYRYRKESGLPLFYDKNVTPTVPSVAMSHPGF
jgi:hypothetical protein